MTLGVVLVDGAFLGPDLLLRVFSKKRLCSWSSLAEVKMPLLARGLTLFRSLRTMAVFMVMVGEGGNMATGGDGVGVGVLDVSFW